MEKKDKKPVGATQSGQAGQAVVEYMLVLVVSIGICGGALWQFNDAFRAFASSYFGSYLACLLETGELPSVGTSSGSSSSSGTCNDSYQAFNISNGRPLNGYAGINAGANGGAGGAGNNSNKSTPHAAAGSHGGAADPSFGRFDQGRPEVALEKKAGAGTPDEKTQGDLGFMGGSAKKPALVSTSEKRTVMDYSSLISSEEEKKEEGRIPVKVASQKNDSLRSKKSKVEEARKPASSEDDEDKEWTVGGFMRWIIIIAIIVALVVFIGGQALQISKGGEE